MFMTASHESVPLHGQLIFLLPPQTIIHGRATRNTNATPEIHIPTISEEVNPNPDPELPTAEDRMSNMKRQFRVALAFG